jgi:hypothetical protein
MTPQLSANVCSLCQVDKMKYKKHNLLAPQKIAKGIWILIDNITKGGKNTQKTMLFSRS